MACVGDTVWPHEFLERFPCMAHSVCRGSNLTRSLRCLVLPTEIKRNNLRQTKHLEHPGSLRIKHMSKTHYSIRINGLIERQPNQRFGVSLVTSLQNQPVEGESSTRCSRMTNNTSLTYWWPNIAVVLCSRSQL